MKHIATFESINSKTDVEDLMLYFEDKGDIRNLKITVLENQTTFRLEFQINEQIIGMEKITLLDEMVKRLNRKYKLIYFESSYLYIDTVHKNYKYIEEPIVEKINDECKILDNLNKYTSSKYPGWEFYGPDDDNIYLDYDTVSKRIHIKDLVWSRFKYRYLLKHKDISEIFKKIIQQKYGFEISEAIYEESGRVI